MGATEWLLFMTLLGFVSLGLPDAIIGIVWPSVSKHFGIPLGDLGIVLGTFTFGYFVSVLSASVLLEKLKIGGLLATSSALVVASLLGFALSPHWSLYIASSIVAGLGAGAIDAGFNAFAARNFSARHVIWIHGSWGIGAALGATVAASAVSEGASWQWAFGGAALIMLPLTGIFTLGRHILNEKDRKRRESSATPIITSGSKIADAIKHPVVWIQALIFFVYVGAEMTAGQWSYTILTKHRGVSEGHAGMAVSIYWASLTIGRFLLGPLADRMSIKTLISVSSTMAVVSGFIFILSPWSSLSMLGLAMLGFSFASIFPGLMSQTPTRLGRLADIAIGAQVATAFAGNVSAPSFGGLLIKSYDVGALNVLLGTLLVSLWVFILALFWSKPIERWSASR